MNIWITDENHNFVDKLIELKVEGAEQWNMSL